MSENNLNDIINEACKAGATVIRNLHDIQYYYDKYGSDSCAYPIWEDTATTFSAFGDYMSTIQAILNP